MSEKPNKQFGAKEGWRLSRSFLLAVPVGSRLYIVAYTEPMVPMR